jgi:peptide/nickel transport system permease protein
MRAEEPLMLGLALRRLLLSVPTLVGIALLVFLLSRLLPGDAVTSLVGPDSSASPERLAELRRLLGLDQPLPVQLWRFFAALLHGDLGTSLRTGRKVATDLWLRGPVTLELAVVSVALATALAVPLAVAAAARPGAWLDRTLGALSSLLLALPHFLLALLLGLLFALRLGWLPPAGWVPLQDSLIQHLRHLCLPVVTLSLLLMAPLWRIGRATVAAELRRDYIRTARAKGLRERAVRYRHALRNAALPLCTAIGLQLGNLLGGAVIVEQVFGIPGVGRLAIEGINLRDYPVVQGATLAIGVAVIAVNLVVDALYALLDPRLRAP